MSTTALIVELVIVGIQVAIWVSMIVALISGYQWLNPETVEKISTPIAVVLLAVCYTIGIIFDAFTALLEDKLLSKRELSKEQKARRRVLRQKLRLKDNALSIQLDNDQYLLRLLRSTTLNLTIIAVCGSILVLKANGLSFIEHLVYVVLLVGAALIGFYGWWRRRTKFVENRDAFYKALEESEKAH
jgi:hypothetical protein